MPAKVLSLRLAGLVFAWVAAVAVVVWLVLASGAVALERGERATAAFAAVVEQQVARTFQAVYLTLGAVADAHQLTPRPAKNDAEFQAMMQRRLQEVPFVRALYIIGPDGRIIHDTDYPKTPNVSLADRPYFSAYLSGRVQGQQAWPPVLSRSGTGWFIPVTRPLGRSGRFEGVVVAALQAGHFREDFRRIGLGEGYVVSLLHADATLVATFPAVGGEVGKAYAELPVFSGPLAAASGTLWVKQGLLPGERVISYRQLEGAPFVVRVSRAKNDVLAEWRRGATGAAVAMLALTLFLGWYVARLARESARRARERERRLQAEKLEALGALTSGLAHDFGNLLQVVALNAAMLRSRLRGAGVEDVLSTLERAVQGGMSLIERLLAFARRRPLSLRPVRLDAWLETSRPLLAQAAGGRIALAIEAQPHLPEIVCDPNALDVALVNLVVNARDAGSGRIAVRAYRRSDQRYVCLAVRDDGPGMSDEVRRRALEPFYTTKGEAGTGLGLSQVSGFMEQAGGTVSIDSAPGRGTAVTLCFPEARESG
jgi:signal transduction histidine kinase